MAQLLNPGCLPPLNPEALQQLTSGRLRVFGTGATRDLDNDKLDYEGYLSPKVIKRFAEYMRSHQSTAAGLRASDNWQNGIPRDAYMKSLLRHVMELWIEHRDSGPTPRNRVSFEDVLCAIMFNAMGYLFELMREDFL